MTTAQTIIQRKKWLKAWALATKTPIPKGFALTGVMGTQARALLQAYQKSVGLAQTGKWNAPTTEKLKAWYERTHKPTNEQRLQYAIDVWYAKRDQTHYSYPHHNAQRMTCPPLPGVAPWTDCSGMIRCMWKQLGWPDPAGQGYAVWGNSDAFIMRARNYGKFIPRGSEKLGDIACYQDGKVGHAELVVSRGRVLTNGNEAGPYYRALGAHSGRLYVCRLAPFA